MADYTIFPSLIPESDTYGALELTQEVEAATLQGIAAAHPTETVNGQSAALEIADWVSGNHTAEEIDAMVALIESYDPPRDGGPSRSEIDLSPALQEDGNLSMY